MYERGEFLPISQDSGRVIANLESAYNTWLETQQAHAALAVSMFWQTKNDTDCLAVKQDSLGQGTTVGPRSAEAEQRLEEFTTRAKTALKAKLSASGDQVVRGRARHVSGDALAGAARSAGRNNQVRRAQGESSHRTGFRCALSDDTLAAFEGRLCGGFSTPTFLAPLEVPVGRQIAHGITTGVDHRRPLASGDDGHESTRCDLDLHLPQRLAEA
jgi:hypothetical protein